jgi:hypothetical protein
MPLKLPEPRIICYQSGEESTQMRSRWKKQNKKCSP